MGLAIAALVVAVTAIAGCAAAPAATAGSPFDVTAGASQIEVLAALDAEAARIAEQERGNGFAVLVIVILLAVAFGGAPPAGN